MINEEKVEVKKQVEEGEEGDQLEIDGSYWN